MPKIQYILADGNIRSVEAKRGTTVMEAAIHNNVRGIDAECGGCCSCATCHVYVDNEFLSRLEPADEMENDLLSEVAVGRQANSRLSCQIIVSDELDGITVQVPQRQV